MLIATRIIIWHRGDADIEIPIRVHAPEQASIDWHCRFEIGWPNGAAQRWGAGVDAIQALHHALQMIGAELYASRQHEAGQLEWLAPAFGYGFPVTNNIRDLLIGGDKRYL